MYEALLIEPAVPFTSSDLYELSSPSLSMLDEIRLARSRLARAVLEDDDKAIQSWLSLLHALVRIQSSTEGDASDSELAALLARVGDDIVEEARS